MTTTQNPSGFVVVETVKGDAYLGTVEHSDGIVTVRSGLRGRPATIPRHEIVEMTAAEDHPDVTFD